MEILSSLASINKISLVVLLAVLIFLSYEIYAYQKEKKRKVSISMPSFQGHSAPPPAPQTVKMPNLVAGQASKTYTAPSPNLKIKQRKKISKKAIGLILITVFMISGIGVISYRLAQPATPGDNLAPVAPRAQEISPSPKLTSDKEKEPTPEDESALVAQNQEVTPTVHKIQSPTQGPTQTPEPTIVPTAIPSIAPTITTLPTIAPTPPQSLPETSSASQFSIGLAAIGITIIILSFVF